MHHNHKNAGCLPFQCILQLSIIKLYRNLHIHYLKSNNILCNFQCQQAKFSRTRKFLLCIKCLIAPHHTLNHLIRKLIESVTRLLKFKLTILYI